jgi:hypothetical protein
MTLSEQKTLVARFLAQCNQYADQKLAQYRRELETADATTALAIHDKIGHWTAYRAFNERAIEELRTDALDAWFHVPTAE